MNHGTKISAEEYEKGVVTLEESDLSPYEKRYKQFQLKLDHLFGVDYPTFKRIQIWTIEESNRTSAAFRFRKILPTIVFLEHWVGSLINLLDKEELASYFGEEIMSRFEIVD